jgi:hypothetical protein
LIQAFHHLARITFHLQNRHFTWSNERLDPTISKLDYVFFAMPSATHLSQTHPQPSFIIPLRPFSFDFGHRRSKSFKHLHMALEIILRSDVAQESRVISLKEAELRKPLKRRVISLAVLERAIKHQCAHIKFVKEGDTTTKLFLSNRTQEEGRTLFIGFPMAMVGSPTM